MFKSPLCNILIFLLSIQASAISKQNEIEYQELINNILGSNLSVEVSKKQDLQAEQRLKSSRSKFFPKLSLVASQYNQDLSYSSFGALGSSISQEGLTSKAMLQWNLFNGFQDYYRNSQRAFELQKYDQDIKATTNTQRDLILSSIFKIMSLQSDIENYEQKIKVDEERERDIQKRFASQSAKKSDLLSVQASILSSKTDMQSAKTDVHVEWRTLSQLANQDLPYNYIQTKNIQFTLISDRSEKMNIEKLPEFKSAQLDYEASLASYHNLQGLYWPSVDLTYNRYFTRPDGQKDNHWDLQLVATWALPLDGEKMANAQEAKILADQKALTIKDKLATKKSDFDKLVIAFNSDLERLDILNKSIRVQDDLSQALKKDYQAGLTTISDYLNSVTTLLQKKQTRDKLQIQQLQRKYQIEKYHENFGDSI